MTGWKRASGETVAYGYSEEECDRAVELISTHGSLRKASEASGLARSWIWRRAKLAAQRGKMGYKPVLPGFKVSRVSTATNADGELTSTHVQQKPEAGEPWAMPEGQVAKGFSALLDADGRVVQQWIKTRTDDVTPHLVQALKSVFADTPRVELIPAPDVTDGALMCVYPIADQHNGLLAWGRETGESYDLKIGAAKLRDTAQRLVAMSPPATRALVLNLGDWQHTDDQKNMTPRSGNILDVDSRYFKILVAGVRLMKDVIELALQRHGHVTVRNIPGNHDPHASIALTVALAEAYADNPRVTIDADPDDFFFYRFGQTLIGATHGHRCKPDRMAMSMAVRRREDWGATAYHWFLFGHIHHESMKEVGDVRCESFQTLAAKDAHAAHSGYNSGQSLNCITLHVEDGEIGRHRVNIAPPSKLCASAA